MASSPSPKDLLAGQTLAGGWRVIQQLVKSQTDTGGHSSTGYIVESATGKRCFLKAIDFSIALSQPDPARALQILTEAFNLERDILEIGKRLSHVVTVIADGTTVVNGGADPVQYLILELADHSLRRMAVISQRLPLSVALTSLHNVAIGLRQLHGQQIAHQDMKPSNVLRFPEGQFKVCDVGRASIKGRAAPHDGLNIAGDHAYAPPELLYGQVDPEFVVRRWGCDAYLLGSLAAFLITAVPMTGLIMNEIHPASRPTIWRGTYGAVLPQVRTAFAKAIDRVGQEIPAAAPYGEELLLCVRQLCDPEPAHRGHPTTRDIQSGGGNVYDLERYISIFERLARRAAIFERISASP